MATEAKKTIFETARESPFTVLGVPADAELRVAYRAYLERLKKHRPGKDGAEYARLTAAYREVRDARRAVGKARAAQLAKPAAETDRAELPDSVEGRRAELHFALAHGQLGRAARLLDALHATGSLDWAALRAETDRELALWLFNEHVDRELLAGRAAALEARVTSPEFGADIANHPGLELVAYRVLGVSARRDPTAALHFLRAHPPPEHVADADPERAAILEQLSLAVTGGAGFWQGVHTGSLLERVLDVGFVAPPPGGELARALFAELGDDAQALEKLDALHAVASPALSRFSRVLEHWAPRDDRVWEELSAPEQSWAWSLTQELETSLEKNWRNRLTGWSLLAVLIASGWLFKTHGIGYGLVTAFAGFVVWAVFLTRGDRKLERTLLRPLFMARLVKTGVSPDRVLECMFHMKTGATDIGRFLDEICLDEPLDTLAAMHRVQSALEQSAHAPPVLRAAPSQRP